MTEENLKPKRRKKKPVQKSPVEAPELLVNVEKEPAPKVEAVSEEPVVSAPKVEAVSEEPVVSAPQPPAASKPEPELKPQPKDEPPLIVVPQTGQLEVTEPEPDAAVQALYGARKVRHRRRTRTR